MKTRINVPRDVEVKKLPAVRLQQEEAAGVIEDLREGLCDWIEGLAKQSGCDTEGSEWEDILCDAINGLLSSLGCEEVRPPEDEPECEDDEDCGTDEFCNDEGFCEHTDIECHSHDDCGEEEVCNEGKCVEGNCVSDSECDDWKECKSNVCELKEDRCDSVEDCEEGYECNEHWCEVPSECETDEDCPQYPQHPYNQVCVDEQCEGDPSDCRYQDDCASPTPVCKQETGNCVECEDDQDCQEPSEPKCRTDNNTCVECLDNNQCPPNWDCVNNACEEPPECEDDQDCEFWEVCNNNQCETNTGGGYCDSDADCTPQYCDNQTPSDSHTCVECLQDGQCEEREVCDNKVCVGDPEDCRPPGTLDCSQQGEYCDESTGGCVECLEDSHCPQYPQNDYDQICSSNSCVGDPTDCRFDPDVCQEPTPACRIADRTCVECTDNSYCDDWDECVSEQCQLKAGRCNDDGDCSWPTDRCDTMHYCVECLTTPECASNEICDNGNCCIPEADTYDSSEQCTSSDQCCEGLVCRDPSSIPGTDKFCLQPLE